MKVLIFRCSIEYWSILILYFPIAILITYFAFTKICKEYTYRISVGYNYYVSDINWNKNILFKFPFYAFISGLLAGVLGIGGGLILGPLLLELGLNPIVIYDNI